MVVATALLLALAGCASIGSLVSEHAHHHGSDGHVSEHEHPHHGSEEAVDPLGPRNS